MSKKQNATDATASALGYYHQGLYGLVRLLRTSDDNTSVSVETLDDVCVHQASGETLIQLKLKTTAKPTPLSIKSDEWWKTIAIWATEIRRNDSSSFVLVTGSAIGKNSHLHLLTGDDDRGPLLSDLEVEAKAVLAAIQLARKRKTTRIPYADRERGCTAFLGLSPQQRARMLSQTHVAPGSFGVVDIEATVSAELQTVHSDVRTLIARRLIEWWNYEVVLSLADKRRRQIGKVELQKAIVRLIRELDDESLPDDLGKAQPPGANVPLPDVASRQVSLVNGTPTHHRRAARDWWRARNQRQRWIDDDLSSAGELDQYDKVLVEEWDDRHGALRDTCESQSDEERATAGLQILDWSYELAPQQVPRIRPNWNGAYFVRGSYQILADDLSVGWHPEFKSLIKAGSHDSSDD